MHNMIDCLTMLKVWRARGKRGKEAREEKIRFKPTGRTIKQATLPLLWERIFAGKRMYDLLLDRSEDVMKVRE